MLEMIFQQVELKLMKSAAGREGRGREFSELGLGRLGEIDRAGQFAMTKCQLRPELPGERPHGVILGAGRDAQALVAFPARFRDQPAEQDGADVLAPCRGFHAEGDLGQQIVLRRMQLGRTADHAVDDVGDNHGAVLGAAGGVTLDEAVVEKAVETVVPACGSRASGGDRAEAAILPAGSSVRT